MTTLFRKKYRVESTRLKGWDYASAGLYFVTICTHDKERFFGNVVNEEMRLSPIGDIAHQYWDDIPKHSPNNIRLDEFIVMPNHIHGIIAIVDDGHPRRDVACNVSTEHAATPNTSPKPGALGAIVRSYKSAVTRWARMNNYANFAWQERYYDHIIRDERELARIRKYIVGNPGNWHNDQANPQARRR